MKFYESELLMASFPKRAVKTILTMEMVGQGYRDTFDKACIRLGSGSIIGFLGERGTGKTVMSVALANVAINKSRAVRYTTAHRLFMAYKDSYRREATQSESDVHNFYRDPSLLVIDEIGRRQESDWENRTLIDLIDARYGDEEDTILISNQEKEVFDDAIGDSIVSRMKEGGGCLMFNWPSYRQ
jgi:DNA replication protein DnaC